MTAARLTIVRGPLVYCRDDPFLTDPATAFVHETDGLLICRDGVIEAVGGYPSLRARIPPGCAVTHYPDCLIAPGFIDTHVHYVQTGIIGGYGKGLLGWLEDYTYPAEQALADPSKAHAMASVFCDELLRNGTTTAMVFCAVYPQSVDALFSEAQARNMRVIADKVLMDRNAPETLRDDVQTGYDQSKALMARWHKNGRNLYAITPRFAGSSSREQLAMAGALWAEQTDVFVQTHIAENRDEVAWMRQLFPERRDYLDIYDHAGLTGRRAVLAHGIYLDEDAFCRCHDSGTALAHCPTSNMFLGSGLFRMRDAKDARRPVHVGIGTDIGAGTSFSMLATLGEGYKVSQLNGAPVSAVEAFFLTTLGGARALALDDKIGTLRAGNEADFIVLDPRATPVMAFREERSRSVEETLFVLMTMGDDRAVRATYVAGKLAHACPRIDS